MGVLYDIRIFSQVLKFTVIIAGVAKIFFDVGNFIILGRALGYITLITFSVLILVRIYSLIGFLFLDFIYNLYNHQRQKRYQNT